MFRFPQHDTTAMTHDTAMTDTTTAMVDHTTIGVVWPIIRVISRCAAESIKMSAWTWQASMFTNCEQTNGTRFVR